MKKIATIFMAFVLVLVSAFTFVGCGMFNNDNDIGNVNNTKHRAADMRSISTKCVVEESDDYLDSMESFYDDDYNYWIFNMGILLDVPLDTVFQYYKYSGGNVSYKYTVTETKANSIKKTTQESASRSTNWSNSDKLSIKGGINFGTKDVWGVSIELGYDHTWTYGGSVSTSWSRSFESCEQKSITEARYMDIDFDDSCPHGYYSYRFIGAVEVFTAIIQDRESREFSAATYTCVKAFGYSLDYDPNSLTFDNYDGSKFDFDLSIINYLEEPTQYLETNDNSGNTPIAVPNLTIYDNTIRTGTTTIYNGNNNVMDIVSFKYPYNQLQEGGYTQLKISLSVDIKEYRTSSDLYNGIAIQDKAGITVKTWEYKRHRGNWETYQIDVDNLEIDRFHMGDNQFKMRIKYYCKDSNFQDWYLGTVKVKVIALP